MNLFDEREDDGEWIDACNWCGNEVVMTVERQQLLGRICDDCSVFAGLDSLVDSDDEYNFE